MELGNQERRNKTRAALSPLFQPYYDSLCALLGDNWQPYAGYRTIEMQNALYNQGRTMPGHIVTNARGPESAHCYGCAADFTIFENGQPIWLKADDVRWQEFETAAWKANVRTGAIYNDPGHAELKISVSYHLDIATVFEENGLDFAMKRIQETMIR